MVINGFQTYRKLIIWERWFKDDYEKKYWYGKVQIMLTVYNVHLVLFCFANITSTERWEKWAATKQLVIAYFHFVFFLFFSFLCYFASLLYVSVHFFYVFVLITWNSSAKKHDRCECTKMFLHSFGVYNLYFVSVMPSHVYKSIKLHKKYCFTFAWLIQKLF